MRLNKLNTNAMLNHSGSLERLASIASGLTVYIRLVPCEQRICQVSARDVYFIERLNDQLRV